METTVVALTIPPVTISSLKTCSMAEGRVLQKPKDCEEKTAQKGTDEVSLYTKLVVEVKEYRIATEARIFRRRGLPRH